MKDEEIRRENASIQALAENERMKLNSNKAYILDRKKEQYNNWKKNQEIKENRQMKETNLENFLTTRLRDEILFKKNEDYVFHQESMNYFDLNCQKLGVELKHDPTKKSKPEKAKFSAIAAMMKIKERKKQADYARKERDVRRRKIQVEQEKLSKETDARKLEENLIDEHLSMMKQNQQICEKKWLVKEEKKFIANGRILVEEERRKKVENYHKEKQALEKELNRQLEINRAEDYKKLALEYREKNLEKRIKKQKVHREICSEIMGFILDLTDICYRDNLQRSELYIESNYWRYAMSQFLDNKPLIMTKKLDIFDSMRVSISSYNNEDDMDHEMNDYLFNLNDWDPSFHFLLDDEAFTHPQNNHLLGEIIFGLIENIFPKKELLPTPDFPRHLPLKIALLGVPLSGKKTMANLLKQKYGLELISPEDVLKEALVYAFPPEETAEQKKAAAKKKPNEKKNEEVVVKDLPELRALGLKAKEANEVYTDELLIEAVLIKISMLFPIKQQEEFQLELKEEKSKASEKLKEIKRLQEEAEKKAKKLVKPSTKASAQKGKAPVQISQEETQQTPEEKLQELINKNPYYYTKGFALLNFPRTKEQARLLEQKLTGHVDLADRKNPDGEFQKQRVGVLAHPNEPFDSLEEDLVSGLDCLVHFSIEIEEMTRRIQGRRVDPQTKIVYHIEDNPPPNDVKGLLDRICPVNDEFSDGKGESLYDGIVKEMNEIKEWYKLY